MPHTYGFLKCKIISSATLQSSRHHTEIQYHLHASVQGADDSRWDVAVNVGTNQASDLLRYRLVQNYGNSILTTLRSARAGFTDLTGSKALPALDFLRSDVLKDTGSWQNSDVMHGSMDAQPLKGLADALGKAQEVGADVYLFGRTYTDGSLGIHDIHMNQGSSAPYINNGVDDRNDHNDTWQDGAVIIDFGDQGVAAYFTAFTQQNVPTDNLGNPQRDSHGITDADIPS